MQTQEAVASGTIGQNLYAMFSSDPAVFNTQSLKAKLAIALVAVIRRREWTQAVAARHLDVSQPRVSNLFRGRLDKFSIEGLLRLLVRAGYTLETDFNPLDEKAPLSVTVKAAATGAAA